MPSHPSISFLNTGLNLYPSPLIVNIYWGHLLSSPIFFRNFLIVCMMLHSLKLYGHPISDYISYHTFTSSFTTEYISASIPKDRAFISIGTDTSPLLIQIYSALLFLAVICQKGYLIIAGVL